jgi:hypothetical protein
VSKRKGCWRQSLRIAATTGKQEGDLSDRFPGDGIVYLNSALGLHENPALTLPFHEATQWVGYGMNHIELINRPEVYDKIRQWLAEGG